MIRFSITIVIYGENRGYSFNRNNCFMKKGKIIRQISEVIYNGNRTYIEDGEVKTILNEEITKNKGDMTVEQLREVLKNEISMIYNNEL